jgi:hypothetical protein
MTTLDELERSVERLNRAVERLKKALKIADQYATGVHFGEGNDGFVSFADLRLLLSERAEILATVERMRVEMAGMETRLSRWEPRVSLDLSVASGRSFGAALTTGEGK